MSQSGILELALQGVVLAERYDLYNGIDVTSRTHGGGCRVGYEQTCNAAADEYELRRKRP